MLDVLFSGNKVKQKRQKIGAVAAPYKKKYKKTVSNS
jgi:hypothetical protein